MIKKNKIIWLLILIILIYITIFLSSCEDKNMEYFDTINNKMGIDYKEAATGESAALDEKSKEFFLELKAKQLDKNPLSDINVRKAIFYAIDREKIVNELYGKYNKVLNSLFPESSYYYCQSWAEYNYDIEKAKEYLEKAGYSIDNPLYIMIGSTSGKDTKQIIEETIKEDLSKIGIEIWIFNSPSEEWYSDYVSKGNYELGLWSIYNFDGSSLINNFNSNKIPSMKTEENKNCGNFYWYKNKDVDNLLETIENESDIEKKKELISNLQDIIASDAIILPLYSRIDTIAYNNEKISNIDVSTINNKIHFNLENWNLNDDWVANENEFKEVIIGYNNEDYGLDELISKDFISCLLTESLWEMNEKGEYEKVLVKDAYPLEGDIDDSAGMGVKIILKDKIFWEDENSITSEDIKYTFDKIMENKDILNINEDYLKIDRIEVINEKEFNIIFKEKIKNWEKLFGLIFPEGSMNGKDIRAMTVKDITANGPYRVEEYKSGEYLLLKKNDFYFNEIPDIDYFKILFDTSFANLVEMLKSGEIDLLNVLFNLDLISELDEKESINLLVKPGNYMEQLAVCLKPKEEQ